MDLGEQQQRRAPPPPPPRGVTLRSTSAVAAAAASIVSVAKATNSSSPPSSTCSSSVAAVSRIHMKQPMPTDHHVRSLMKENLPTELASTGAQPHSSKQQQGYLETRYAYSVNGILGSAAQASAAAAFFARYVDSQTDIFWRYYSTRARSLCSIKPSVTFWKSRVNNFQRLLHLLEFFPSPVILLRVWRLKMKFLLNDKKRASNASEKAKRNCILKQRRGEASERTRREDERGVWKNNYRGRDRAVPNGRESEKREGISPSIRVQSK